MLACKPETWKVHNFVSFPGSRLPVLRDRIVRKGVVVKVGALLTTAAVRIFTSVLAFPGALLMVAARPLLVGVANSRKGTTGPLVSGLNVSTAVRGGVVPSQVASRVSTVLGMPLLRLGRLKPMASAEEVSLRTTVKLDCGRVRPPRLVIFNAKRSLI